MSRWAGSCHQIEDQVMQIQSSILSRTVLTALLLALPLGAAYAQGKGTVILNCSYAESNHVPKTAQYGGGEQWFPAHDVVYHICAGCTVDREQIENHYSETNPPTVWIVTDSEYSYDYNYQDSLRVSVKIERYSGSATATVSSSGDPTTGGFPVFWTSSGKCQKADKPLM
jgi:hypothetical protein